MEMAVLAVPAAKRFFLESQASGGGEHVIVLPFHVMLARRL